MIVKQPTEHHLEFLSLKGGYRSSSESTHVKMPLCWKSHVIAYIEMWLKSINNYNVTIIKDSLTISSRCSSG